MGPPAQGREISYIVLTSGEALDKPAIYFNGAHHGDERSTPEAILGLAQHLIDHQQDPEVAALLQKYRIVLQPIVNPDGLAAGTRRDSEGNDLNREYPFPRQWVRFGTPKEVELVESLMAKFSPKGAVTVHTGTEAVLWPWAFL